MTILALAALVSAYAAVLLWRGRLWLPVRVLIAARHGRWAIGLWLGYGLPALMFLALAGQWGALRSLPPAFLPLSASVDLRPGDIGLGTVATGLAGGSVLGLLATWWRARRGRAPWTAGDARAIMPTSDAELLPATALAISAGVTEELFFRLALPLALTLLTGTPAIGCGLAIACFAAMHRYQGRVGVVATAIGGALMTALYLGSGALWLPIAAHALTDLNALVLRPAVSGRIRRRAVRR